MLTLDFAPDRGILTVEDDGRGMAPGAAPDPDGGNGLRIMRHRADIPGGTLRIDTSPSSGTRLAVTFPSTPA